VIIPPLGQAVTAPYLLRQITDFIVTDEGMIVGKEWIEGTYHPIKWLTSAIKTSKLELKLRSRVKP
jgi:hypothetical protein